MRVYWDALSRLDRVEAMKYVHPSDLNQFLNRAPSLIGGWELLTAAVQIVVRGERGDGASDALIGAVVASPVVNRVLQVVPPDAALPPGHPAEAMTQVDGRATACVCRGPTCSLPITDAAALGAALAIPSDDPRPAAAPSHRVPQT